MGGEVGQFEPDPILPEALVYAHVPGLAALGLQVRVAEVREEEIVECRGAEARAGAPAKSRPCLLDHEGDRSLSGGRLSEHAVVLDPEAAGDEQAVEEAQLLLEHHRGNVAGGAEDALVVALLVAVGEAEGGRAPRPDEKRVEPLGLAPLDVHLGAERDIEVEAGVDRILEALVVGVARDAGAALPPFNRPRPALEAHHRGLGLLLGVGVDDGHDGLGRREDALDRHARLVLVVAIDEGERAVEGQRDADPPVERVDVRAVVLELPVALEVRARERVVEDLVRAAERDPAVQGVVVAAEGLDRSGEGTRAFLRDDVDHAADGVGAVEGGLPAADHLDPLDQIGGDIGEVSLSERGARDAHPVHEDQDLVGVGAADGHGRELAVAAGLLDADARNVPERVVERRVVIGLDVLARDHAQGHPHLLARRVDRGRRHHYRVHLLRLLGCRGRGHRQHHDQHHVRWLSHDRSFSLERGLHTASRTGLLARGSLPPPGLPGIAPSGFRNGYGRDSPLTVAGPCRLLTGFP